MWRRGRGRRTEATARSRRERRSQTVAEQLSVDDGVTLGVCLTMCSESDLNSDRTLHEFERWPAVGYRCPHSSPPLSRSATILPISAFRRSAAGRGRVVPSDIRPLDVLEQCVDHLVECTKRHPSIECRSVAVFARRFAFVSDRFRAIRAEMTLQALLEGETKSQGTVASVASILERMIQFHAHAHDELLECAVEAFDPKQNDRMLFDCFGSLIPLYQFLPKTYKRQHRFRAYRALINIIANPTESLLELVEHSSQDAALVPLNLAAFALLTNNYVAFFNTIRDSVDYTGCCLLLRFFTQVRVNALTCMNRTYMKRSRYPLVTLQRVLGFGSVEHAVGFLTVLQMPLVGSRTSSEEKDKSKSNVLLKESQIDNSATSLSELPHYRESIVAKKAPRNGSFQ